MGNAISKWIFSCKLTEEYNTILEVEIEQICLQNSSIVARECYFPTSPEMIGNKYEIISFSEKNTWQNYLTDRFSKLDWVVDKLRYFNFFGVVRKTLGKLINEFAKVWFHLLWLVQSWSFEETQEDNTNDYLNPKTNDFDVGEKVLND